MEKFILKLGRFEVVYERSSSWSLDFSLITQSLIISMLIEVALFSGNRLKFVISVEMQVEMICLPSVVGVVMGQNTRKLKKIWSLFVPYF